MDREPQPPFTRLLIERSSMLSVADDGIEFDPADASKDTGLGCRLVRAMAVQRGGRVEMQSGEGTRHGTVCTTRSSALAQTMQAT